ncbi:MAG: HepT-like ribonuclease domain-containing protein [bacterium]
MVGLVNFRNILVHAYLEIDRQIVYENLKHLDDFRQFMKYLTRYLKE